MTILSTLILILATILNSVELSSQSESLPNSSPILGVPRSAPSYTLDRNHSPNRQQSSARYRSRSPSDRHPPAEFPPTELDPAGFHQAGLPPVEYDPTWFHPSEFDTVGFHLDESPVASFSHAGSPPVRPYSPDRPPPPEPALRARSRSPSSRTPPAEPTLRSKSSYPPSRPPNPARCMVPPTILPFSEKRVCGIERLEFIRLTCKTNPHLIFHLRRYTFPVNKEMYLKIGKHTYYPMPKQEYIVISTSDGEVFAILESTYTLAGMYYYYAGYYKRAKINVESGKVTRLTKQEINEVPVGPQRPITNSFQIKQVKYV